MDRVHLGQRGPRRSREVRGAGLDARAFWLKIAAVGGVTANALRDWASFLTRSPSSRAATSSADWSSSHDVLDLINRVFLPRADIATETPRRSPGDGRGGRRRHGLPTVRRPAGREVRDAIKSGAYHAVFTSSLTVRILVGIAGKPHLSTVVAVIGPATAKAAEEAGLHVDVMAPEASSDALVDALAAHGLGSPSPRRRPASWCAGPARRSRPPVAAPADIDRGRPMGVEPR